MSNISSASLSINSSSSRDSDDVSPLRLSCIKGDSEELERHLLDFNEDINTVGNDGNSLLHLSAQIGSAACVKLLLDRDARTDIANPNKDTPLHLAALSGSPDCVRYLIDSGANLIVHNKDHLTPLTLILENIPDGEAFLQDMFDECIEVTRLISGKEQIRVSMKLLCPSEEVNRMALANVLYTKHKNLDKLLLHPLLKILISLEWDKNKHFIWYRFSTYMIYLIVLAFYISIPPDSVFSTITRVMVGFTAVHVMLFAIAYICPGQYSCLRKSMKCSVTLLPPLLSLVTVILPYNAEMCGMSFLFSWLSLPLYTNAIYVIGNQAGMFVYVIKEVGKHSLVLLFVLVGFSLTFFVLYYDKESHDFDNFWHAFLYTTLVLLQGDNMGDFPIFGKNGTATNGTETDNLNYITEALLTLRIPSVIVSILFVFVVVIALVNMLVALAIRGGEELKNYGQIYHLWSQVQLLYEWGEVTAYFVEDQDGYESLSDRDHEIDSNIPLKIRNELRRLVHLRNRRNRELS